MFGRWHRSLQAWFRALMQRTSDELGRRERLLRFLIEAGRIAGRQMRRDRAAMMAAALTYRLLFALVPLMVIAAAVIQIFVSRKQVTDATEQLVSQLQLNAIQVHDQRLDAAMDGSSPFSLGSWIVQMATRAVNYDASGLTIVGGIVLLYSAIKLFREIETSFSIVSGRGRRRVWWRRWSMYAGVLLLGPLAVIGGLWTLRWGSSQLMDIGSDHVGLVRWAEMILGWLLIWGVIVLGYLFVPAHRLSFGAVAIGGVVASIVLLTAHWGFRVYVRHAVVGSPMGSLGLVPLFLFWLYLNWLSLLYGLQFAAVAGRIGAIRQRLQTT